MLSQLITDVLLHDGEVADDEPLENVLLVATHEEDVYLDNEKPEVIVRDMLDEDEDDIVVHDILEQPMYVGENDDVDI